MWFDPLRSAFGRDVFCFESPGERGWAQPLPEPTGPSLDSGNGGPRQSAEEDPIGDSIF